MYRPPPTQPPVRPPGSESGSGPPRPRFSVPGQPRPVRPFPGAAPQTNTQAPVSPPPPAQGSVRPPPPGVVQSRPFRPPGAGQAPPPPANAFAQRAPFGQAQASPVHPPATNGSMHPPGGGFRPPQPASMPQPRAPFPSNPPPVGTFAPPSAAMHQPRAPFPPQAQQAPQSMAPFPTHAPGVPPAASFPPQGGPGHQPMAPFPPQGGPGHQPMAPFPPQGGPGHQPMAPFPPPGAAPGFAPPSTNAPHPPGPFAPMSSRPSSPRIDPSQIPRPTENDSDPPSQFETRLNGQHNIPPPAGSRVICKDTGNCDPKFMRLSLNNVPSSSELCSNVCLPLLTFMQPMALQKPEEEPIPVVDFGEGGPVRCGRCRAYMNPFMYFQDGGRSFVCPFCNVKNETPADYFCYLSHDGKRRDALDRPELSRVIQDRREAVNEVHFFLIDASFGSVTSGALHTVCNSIKATLDCIQGQDRALVAIATFDACIQFYQAKAADGSPQVLIVSDITEVFAPLPTLLMPLIDNKESIVEILDLIPKLYENQTNSESCAGAAIEAAIEVLKPTGGKLHAMLTTRPTKGNRALKPREAPVTHSAEKADKEKQLILLPQDNTYRTLGLRAAEVFVCIDLFCLAQHYVDISTIGVLSQMTAGSVYNYEKFTVQHCGQQFLNDLRWNLSRPQGLEAVLRLRCSPGLEIESYLGSMNVRNQHEIELPAIDCDKSIMAKMLYDDKVQEGTEAFFQCALLYTTTTGQRRIRVCTMGVPVTATPNQIFRGADLECFLNYLARKISVTLPGNTLHQAREMITHGCANALAAYRKWCASAPSSTGQLILPDSMKLLPLYTLGLLKSTALRFDSKPDERAAFLTLLLSLPCSKILHLVYGRLIQLDPLLESDTVEVPESLALSSVHLEEMKLFLFENGHEMMIKVESQVPSQTLEALFGFSQVNIKGPEPAVIVSEHPMNLRLQKLLNALRTRATAYMSLRIALRSTASEAKFLGHLVDDRSTNGPSYVEYLCSIHRSIQKRLA